MSEHCEFVNEEKSNGLAWHCNITGREAKVPYVDAYCGSKSDCVHCPVRGGDNSILNPEPLTEEICSSIINSVAQNINAAMSCMSEALSEIQGRAGMTGYHRLVDEIYRAIEAYISPPQLSGEYTSIVYQDDEEEVKRAESLEESLNTLFEQVQFSGYANGYCSESLRISSSDFSVLSDTIQSCEGYVYGEICGPVEGTYSKYIEPAEEMQERMGDEFMRYLEEIVQSVYQASEIFESGCSSAFSSVGSLGSGYGPFGPEWRWQ